MTDARTCRKHNKSYQSLWLSAGVKANPSRLIPTWNSGASMADVRQILPTPRDHGGDSLQEETGIRQYIVSNENRWSRATLEFRDLSQDAWCELAFQICWHPEEKSRTAHDFAVIGIDFLTEDGSSIDFANVPGLTRAQIDPQSCHIAGPDYYDPSSDLTHSARVHCTFLLPSPTKHISVNVRSWRNSHPFTILDPKLLQVVQPTGDDVQVDSARPVPSPTPNDPRRSWIRLKTEPTWLTYGVVPAKTLFVRGQLINQSGSAEGALARVVFRNRSGEIVASQDDLPTSPIVGAYIDIPVNRQTRRFTLELSPPDQAETVDLGFQVWRDEALISLVTPLETSLDDDLLLESIVGEEILDSSAVAGEIFRRLRAAPSSRAMIEDTDTIDRLIDHRTLAAAPTIQDKLQAVQQGQSRAFVGSQLTLGSFPAWSLPSALDWTEDPYQSPAWRMEYQSLSWLLDLIGHQGASGVNKAVDLAASWSHENPSGRPKDPLSAYPASAATRTEVLLRLLAATTAHKNKPIGKLRMLVAEVIQHGFALAEILSQNIFVHSMLQVRVACALLSASTGLSNFPLSLYWKSVALAQLRNGFDHLLGPNGSSNEQSQHYRLELISIGMILAQHLKDYHEAEDLRQLLADRLKDSLKSVVAATNPAGMLAPFGDSPSTLHHASWLRRLISGYGRHLLSDQALAEELAYPLGPRLHASDHAGLITIRNYMQKPDWSHLCASINEQKHDNGHHDCTSFVYSARGVKWITDPGGSGSMEAGPVRQYLLSSRAHNVAIPNSREQTAGLGWLEVTRSLDNAHAVRIGTNVHGPCYRHSRIFVCMDDMNAVAILDHFRSSQTSNSFEAHLHIEDNIAVALAKSNLAIAFHKRDRLRIVPHSFAGQFTGFKVQNGSPGRAGSMQGYLSNGTGGLKPANVLSYGFNGASDICGGVILAITEESLRSLMNVIASQQVQDLLV
ncbi:heparinase II/III family protein [Microvirga sp. BT688]|uniref:heparinase II/III domain-containing protein n=1 Tax=Microvirga sp. TaxID=1873136 RepID=UPI001682C4D8|nr:heparinase II/III family protein [Microvirga sp.]MBD2745558.1 heparinase II/III family protein [Microvirga sp.]